MIIVLCNFSLSLSHRSSAAVDARKLHFFLFSGRDIGLLPSRSETKLFFVFSFMQSQNTPKLFEFVRLVWLDLMMQTRRFSPSLHFAHSVRFGGEELRNFSQRKSQIAGCRNDNVTAHQTST